MPQHRIKAKTAVTSGGGGSGPCPPGFTDAVSFNIRLTDSNAVPTDAASFAIALALSDSNIVPTDSFALKLALADANAGHTDSFALKLGLVDSNAGQTETLQLNLGLSDSNAGQTETLQLKFPPPDFADNNVAPTDINTFTMRVWLSASAGTGSTNPTNANGSNNGVVATLQTAVLGTNPITLISTLGANIPTAIITSVIYRGWFRSANTLVTSTGSLIMHSTSALFTDIVMFSNSGLGATVDHLTGTFTFDLIAAGINTLAKLQSCQMYHRVQDAVAGVTPHVLTVDAGCVEIIGAF